MIGEDVDIVLYNKIINKQQQIIENTNKELINVIYRYTTGEMGINDSIIQLQDLDQEEDQENISIDSVDIIDTFILSNIVKNMSIDEDFYVYRGLNFHKNKKAQLKAINDINNLNYINPIVMSTSLSQLHTLNFKGNKCCLLKIKIPKHMPFLCVSAYAYGYQGDPTHSEYEIILLPGSKLKLTDHSQDGYFELEYIEFNPIFKNDNLDDLLKKRNELISVNKLKSLLYNNFMDDYKNYVIN